MNSRSPHITAHTSRELKVTLIADSKQLQGIVVKAKRRHKYSRKDNPAVEFIRTSFYLVKKPRSFLKHRAFKFMSSLLGKQTIDVRNTSRSYGQTGSGSTSHQKIARDLMTPDEVGNMKRDECLVRIAGVPVFKEKKYLPLKHQNWQYLADKETDARWWHYQIDPLSNNEALLDLSDYKVRDLSTERTLH